MTEQSVATCKNEPVLLPQNGDVEGKKGKHHACFIFLSRFFYCLIVHTNETLQWH